MKSNWSVVVNYDLVEFSGKTFIKAIATASNREEKEQAVAFAELSPVPILKTRNGDLKQMNEPQWVGAVQSYAGKYALQALFAIGEEDVDHFEVAEESLRQNQPHQEGVYTLQWALDKVGRQAKRHLESVQESA